MRMLLLSTLRALILASSSPPVRADITPLSDWQGGIATYYGGAPDGMDPNNPSFGTSVGSCGYGYLDRSRWPFWNVGALATSNQFYTSLPLKGCGICLEVQCVDRWPFQGRCNPDPNQRTTYITITDSCPECGPDHIDMQALTYAKIAPAWTGRVSIQYRQIACTPPGNVQVNVDQYWGGSWIRLTVAEVQGWGSIANVEVRGSDGGSYRQMQNKWGATWELSGLPPAPLSLRLTDRTGAVLEAPNIVPYGGATGTFWSSVQFPMPSGVSVSSSSFSSSSTSWSFSSSSSGSVTSSFTSSSGSTSNVQSSTSSSSSSSSASAESFFPAAATSGGNLVSNVLGYLQDDPSRTITGTYTPGPLPNPTAAPASTPTVSSSSSAASASSGSGGLSIPGFDTSRLSTQLGIDSFLGQFRSGSAQLLSGLRLPDGSPAPLGSGPRPASSAPQAPITGQGPTSMFDPLSGPGGSGAVLGPAAGADSVQTPEYRKPAALTPAVVRAVNEQVLGLVPTAPQAQDPLAGASSVTAVGQAATGPAVTTDLAVVSPSPSAAMFNDPEPSASFNGAQIQAVPLGGPAPAPTQASADLKVALGANSVSSVLTAASSGPGVVSTRAAYSIDSTGSLTGPSGVVVLSTAPTAPGLVSVECPSGDLYSRAREQGLNTFLSLATLANLTSILRARPGVLAGVTVFAPTNEAMAQLITSPTLRNMSRIGWENFMYSLVVPRSVDLRSIQAQLARNLTTLEGLPLEIESCPTCPARVRINNASLLRPDLQACNGLLHVVSTGLVPPPAESLFAFQTQAALNGSAGNAASYGPAGLETLDFTRGMSGHFTESRRRLMAMRRRLRH